jgi:hypothetical protein
MARVRPSTENPRRGEGIELRLCGNGCVWCVVVLQHRAKMKIDVATPNDVREIYVLIQKLSDLFQ